MSEHKTAQLKSRADIRPLEASDYAKQYLALLVQLSPVEDMGPSRFAEILRKRRKQGLRTWVVEDNARIVATITLILEQKLCRNGAYVGHIEDVVVDTQYRHLALGSTLLRTALDYAYSQGCYKVILDCKEELRAFYEKNGFTQRGIIQMSAYAKE